MLKTSLCDYGDAYVLAKETISVTNTAAQGVSANNYDKEVVLKIVLHLQIAQVK